MSVSPWPCRADQPSAAGPPKRLPTRLPIRRRDRTSSSDGSISQPHPADTPIAAPVITRLAGRSTRTNSLPSFGSGFVVGGARLTAPIGPARVAGRARVIVLVLMFLAGIGFVATMNIGIAVTNEMEFCVSCHTMQTNYLEYQETRHFKNASGVQATCSDCHVPKPFGPKVVTKVIAAKDVWHEIIGTIDTPEKFEARRWHMANQVWDKMRRNNSRECRSCHEFANMDLSEQPRMARSRHSRAEDRGETCIDCHAGVVHAMPDEPPAPEETDES